MFARHPGGPFRHLAIVLSLVLVLGLFASACTTKRTSSSSSSTTSAAPAATVAQANGTASSSATTASTSAATPASSNGVVAATPDATPATTPDQGQTTAAPSALTALENAFENVANRVKPAIVQISNEQQVQNFFNQQPYLDTAGIGSGIIYDSDGHILTNDHVIAGNQKLVVALPDGRSFPATVVGADPQSDLAVIQIHGDNLPVAQLGDSSTLKVGQWVVAIGNALALEGGPTLTVGVVSALNRSVTEPGNSNSNTAGPTLVDVIQTDAAINPGNSGGALVNLNGQVIGINTLIAGQAEPGVQAEGIGFAIAINTVKKIAGELVQYGHAIHPYLGISYTSVSPSIALQFNLKVKQGALVSQVAQNSPAAHAGVKPGDVITEIDGNKINTDSALAIIMNNHKPGDEVTLTINRDGKTLELKVKLGEFPTGTPQS